MTTKKYLCSMWLEVGVPDTDDNAAAKAAFDKIWPGKIGSRWHNMLVEAKDDVEFLKKINNEFVNRAKILKSSPKGLMDPYGALQATFGSSTREWATGRRRRK